MVRNADGVPTRDSDRLRRALHDHLLAPVQWAATSASLADPGVGHVVECGACRVLGPLVQQMHPEVSLVQITGPDLDALPFPQPLGRSA